MKKTRSLRKPPSSTEYLIVFGAALTIIGATLAATPFALFTVVGLIVGPVGVVLLGRGVRGRVVHRRRLDLDAGDAERISLLSGAAAGARRGVRRGRVVLWVLAVAPLLYLGVSLMFASGAHWCGSVSPMSWVGFGTSLAGAVLLGGTLGLVPYAFEMVWPYDDDATVSVETALELVTDHDDPAVRQAAVRHLAAADDPWAVAHLRSIARDDADPFVAALANAGLQRVGAGVAPRGALSAAVEGAEGQISLAAPSS